MNNDELYNAIRTRLNELIPSRLELKEGCFVRDFMKGTLEILAVYTSESESPVYDYVFRGEHEVSVARSPRGNWDILGTPPTLQEVLLFLDVKDAYKTESKKLCISTYTTNKDDDYGFIQYDITLPLQDQSTETLQAIHDLLV